MFVDTGITWSACVVKTDLWDGTSFRKSSVTIHSIAHTRSVLPGRRANSCVSPGFMTNVMRDLCLVVIEVTDGVIHLSQGEVMNFGNLFWVFACLEEQNDVTHTGVCALNDRLASIDGGVANDVGMSCTFNGHRLLLPQISSLLLVYAARCNVSTLYIPCLYVCYISKTTPKSLTGGEKQVTIDTMKGGGV